MQKNERHVTTTVTKPPPCDSCKMKLYCSNAKTACYAFARYAGGVQGIQKTRYQRNPRKPFREIFLAMYNEENAHAD